MKRPFLRVTKWLGDIPVEANCTSCSNVSFRAKGSDHRPRRVEYQKSLEAQFDEHVRLVHAAETDAAESALDAEEIGTEPLA